VVTAWDTILFPFVVVGGVAPAALSVDTSPEEFTTATAMIVWPSRLEFSLFCECQKGILRLTYHHPPRAYGWDIGDRNKKLPAVDSVPPVAGVDTSGSPGCAQLIDVGEAAVRTKVPSNDVSETP